jgi:hypothetical protein
MSPKTLGEPRQLDSSGFSRDEPMKGSDDGTPGGGTNGGQGDVAVPGSLSMRVPKLFFSTRRMILVIATLAAALSMGRGVGGLLTYRANIVGLKGFREDAAEWQRTGDAARALDTLRTIADVERFDRKCLADGATTVFLTALGIVLGLLGLVLQAVSRAGRPVELRWAVSIARACLTSCAILWSGLVLGIAGFFAVALIYAAYAE